jgi:DNA topoisomerase IB
MPISPLAFLDIEASLADRLYAGWQQESQPLLQRIWDALEAGDTPSAIDLANGVNLSALVEKNADYIEHLSTNALLFGATRVTPDPKATSIPGGNFDDILQSSHALLASAIKYNVEDRIRFSLLEAISDYDLGNPATNFTLPDGRLADYTRHVVKFDPNQPRDDIGRWTDGGGTEATQATPGTSGLAGQDAGRDSGGTAQGIPTTYRRRNRAVFIRLAGTVEATRWSTAQGEHYALNARGFPAPDYLELQGANAAKAFREQITAAKAASATGAAVYVYPTEDYANMRLFLTDDGNAGFAVKPDGDIVSLFNKPGGLKGITFSALNLAVQAGGRKLDAFDTVLPKLYSEAGFTVRSRLKWDESQAPAGWNKTGILGKFNNGEPDVVFMTFDPDRKSRPYQKGEGRLVATYDEAVALQEQHVRKWDESQHPRDPKGSPEGGQFTAASSNVRTFEHSLGTKRKDMPQIRSKDMPEFMEWAGKQGVAVTPTTETVANLKPAQSEYNQKQVEQISPEAGALPITVSRDNYVLDGTNRYVYLLQANPQQQVNVRRIDLPAKEALRLMHRFPKSFRKDVTMVGATGAEVTVKFDEEKHPRHPAGSEHGGEFSYANAYAEARSQPEYEALDKAHQAATKALDDKRTALLDAAKKDILEKLEGHPDLDYLKDPTTLNNLASHVVLSDLGDKLKPEAEAANKAYDAAQQYVADYVKERAPPISPFAEEANQLNPQTNTPEFKAWFEGSKVHDGSINQNPLVAFHGSQDDIEAFDTTMSGGRPETGNWCGPLGTWFGAPSMLKGNYDPGNAESVASDFAREQEGSVVYPVYLSIKKPMEYEGYEDLQDAIGTKGSEALRERLLKKGYDGVVVRNSMTDGDADRDDWVAFHPEQIKSAIGNIGKFDPKSKLLVKADWDESKHPRDEKGRWEAMPGSRPKGMSEDEWYAVRSTIGIRGVQRRLVSEAEREALIPGAKVLEMPMNIEVPGTMYEVGQGVQLYAPHEGEAYLLARGYRREVADKLLATNVDPSSPKRILESLHEAGKAHVARQARIEGKLATLPEGHKIGKWSKQTVAGDVFWTNGKKYLSGRQLLEEVGSEGIAKHIGEEEVYKWDESQHPREPAGSPGGGQFASAVAPEGHRERFQKEMYQREGIADLNYDQMVAKLGDERLHAAFQEVRELQHAWDAQMKHALAMGAININDAYKQGAISTSIDIKDVKSLPQELYHVTTDVDAVIRDGLKTRDELKQGLGKGLGGGTSDTISFTTDRAIADDIKDAMHLVHDLLNDKVSMAELVDKATKGEDAKQPFIREIANSWGGALTPAGVPLQVDAAMRGRVVEFIGPLDKRYPRGLSVDDPNRDERLAAHLGQGYQSEGKDTFMVSRPATEREVNDIKMQFVKKYLAFREAAGGKLDPLFFMTDENAFKVAPRDSIQTLQVKPKAGTTGYKVSALGEWRAWTGDVVDEVRVVGRKMELIWKYDPDQLRDEQGRWTFSKGGGSQETTVGHTTVTYGVSSAGDSAELILMETPLKHRGKGSGRRALEKFLREADKRGLQVKLNAVPMDSKTDAEKLKKFYESVGFVVTGGDTMARKYDPDQPRDPKGSSTGGRWTARGGSPDIGSNKIPVEKQPTREEIYREGLRQKIPSDEIFVAFEDRVFKLGNVEYPYAGSADMDRKMITIYPHYLSKEVMPGVVAHEAMHLRYAYASEAIRAEHKLLMEDKRDVMRPDGTIRDGTHPADKGQDYTKEYPIHTISHETPSLLKLAEADGITPYSRAWWAEANKNPPLLHSAINETLAEMHRIKMEQGSAAKHTKEWEKLYSDTNKIYVAATGLKIPRLRRSTEDEKMQLRLTTQWEALQRQQAKKAEEEPLVFWFDAEWNVVDEADAVIGKVVFPNGDNAFIQPVKSVAKYDEDQPRDPKGSSTGGQWSASVREQTVGMAFDPERKLWTHPERRVTEREQAVLRSFPVPPGWVNVHVNPDETAPLQVLGQDAAGRWQPKYSVKWTKEAAIAKFERGRDFDKISGRVITQVEKDMNDPDRVHEAAAMRLIQQTGIRIGGEKGEGVAHTAIGASNLKGQHVKLDGDKITLNFTGKSAVRQHFTLTDPLLASYIRGRGLAKGKLVFDTTDAKMREYFKGVAGSEFKVKDVRMWVGTAHAIKELKKQRQPRNEKEFKEMAKEVAKKVSKVLGNTPAMAMKAYIDPLVWQPWNEKFPGALEPKKKVKKEEAMPLAEMQKIMAEYYSSVSFDGPIPYDWRDMPETGLDPDDSEADAAAIEELDDDPLDLRKKVGQVEQKAETFKFDIVHPFVSFRERANSEAEKALQLVSGLHTSRLSAYGFTVEAEVTGVTTYAISAQLDNRVCSVCVLEGQRVAFNPGDTTAVSKRFYKGEAVTLELSSGQKLTVTPNHPILTRRGWVAAGLLDEGDDIVCGAGAENESLEEPQHVYREARVEEVFEAFSLIPGARSTKVPVSAEDFHGDGFGEEVTIIGTDSKPWLSFNSGFVKACEQLPFFRALLKRRVSQLEVATAFCHEGSEGGSSSDPANLVCSGNDYVGGGSSLGDPFAFQHLVKTIRASDFGYTKDFFHRNLGEVQFNRLVHKSVRVFEGHVYNLSTRLNFYLAEGIIVHNCEYMHGKTFQVEDATDALNDILKADDPDDLKTLQPWPGQSKQDVSEMMEMTDEELIDRNWHLPPWHPACRCILVKVEDVHDITQTPSYRAAHPSLDSVFTNEAVLEASLSLDEAIQIRSVLGGAESGKQVKTLWNQLKQRFDTEVLESLMGVSDDVVQLGVITFPEEP